MKIESIAVGAYQANCYIVYDEKTMDGVIIDPGDEGEKIKKMIEDADFNPKYILITHGHADHTGAVSFIKSFYDVPVVISSKDVDIMKNGEYLFGTLSDDEKNYVYVNDNDELKAGSLNIKCIETPGHTPGGISFVIGNSIFTGDTLFFESVGRTDLSSGSTCDILNSVRNKLFKFGNDFAVYPGHGPKTTIGHEKLYNPYA